ncbi:formate--tetrahydrofolate ligase [Candidatus Aerophobetes bacterium]|uniref:Formate--tetrahydrofolate ligase n=1 Tax=Aerophobetes bacterium TaxID=2030807 RepID=A0A523UTS6_UNCAE|nr:MAG: formate--tetrahydrofolate ligase [Candidatus Aerophobetes bacterium]
MLSDLEIAQAAKPKPIAEIAKDLGLEEDEIEFHGKHIAKISLEVLERLKNKPNGKFITVTAITPTPLGEGKTVVACGLGQALAKIGKRVCSATREPSKGPTFGIKGGACGGGYSQFLPMENINLHFTGDIHAVDTAHNLLAARIDETLLHGNPYHLDPHKITWRYCVDINARSLRQIIVGLGGPTNGYPRETGYDITVATETMAILALATSLKDLRERLGRTVVGYTYDGKSVTAEDLKMAGVMTVLMKDAIKPNLVQTIENTPAICHAGPFANVAHGNNSALADMVALKLADYVVTESGFGADCGFEKIVDVTCRQSGLKLDAAVIVASIRALKMHGGAFVLKPGQKYQTIKKFAETENMPALEKGCENMAKAIDIVKTFGVPAVVAINRFTPDTDAEIELVRRKALEAGAEEAVPVEVWAKGGEGGIKLAEAVVAACEKPNHFHFLYPDDIPIKEKIHTIATKIYGAKDVHYNSLAEERIKLYTKLGFDKLPINMAKTHLSLSHDPNLKGVPKNFVLPVRDVRASVGAGFLYPLCGVFPTMPGLPSRPAAVDVDIDETGKTIGLF